MKEPINSDFIYEKLWRDGLCGIVSETQAKEIATDFLIPNKIDPFAFAHNYEVVLRRGGLSFGATFFPDKGQDYYTASIVEASNALEYVVSMPDWFIAACPDVFLWHGNTQRQQIKSRRDNEDAGDVVKSLTYELYGISPEDTSLEIDDLTDGDGKWLPKWFNNLAASYKRKTGKNLETSLAETKNDLVMDFYEHGDVMAEMAESGLDTYTIIARKTTMYYVELLKSYRQRFRNHAGLLAAAGVLDAHVYVFMYKNIRLSEIVELAEKAVNNENDFFTQFIIGLEAKMLAVDTPQLSYDMVEEACQDQKPRICEEIERVGREYKSDPAITKDVQFFMESPNFAEIRKQLGITGGKPNEGELDFFKLNTYEELFSELITRKHWMNLNVDILKRIFKRAQSDIFPRPNEGIEVIKHFIFVSECYNLVEDQFLGLASTADDLDLDILLGYFSFHLHQLGSDFAKRCMLAKTEEEIEGYGMPADMAFMSSILCNDSMLLPSYAGMAILHGETLGNKDVGLEFCAKYKTVVDTLLNTSDNELSPSQLRTKELLDPKNLHKTLERIKQDAPDLLPDDAMVEDEELSQRDYIEQLEKKLMQL